MKILSLLAGIVALAVIQSGCATNGFTQFYEPNPYFSGQRLPFSGELKIFITDDIPGSKAELYRDNYEQIGHAEFSTTASPTDTQLRTQARKVQAEIVLLRVDYLGAEQGTRVVPQYTPGQTYTTHSSGTANATAYGSGGYATARGNYSGQSTTKSSGTWSSVAVPTTYHCSSHEAYFFVRSPERILGIWFDQRPGEMRSTYGRNTGLMVALVVNNSPASKANILKGDLIIAVGDTRIESRRDFSAKQHAGSEVLFTVLRDGNELKIPVKLNPLPQ